MNRRARLMAMRGGQPTKAESDLRLNKTWAEGNVYRQSGSRHRHRWVDMSTSLCALGSVSITLKLKHRTDRPQLLQWCRRYRGTAPERAQGRQIQKCIVNTYTHDLQA